MLGGEKTSLGLTRQKRTWNTVCTQSNALISIFSQPQDCICRCQMCFVEAHERHASSRGRFVWSLGNHKDLMIETESMKTNRKMTDLHWNLNQFCKDKNDKCIYQLPSGQFWSTLPLSFRFLWFSRLIGNWCSLCSNSIRDVLPVLNKTALDSLNLIDNYT